MPRLTLCALDKLEQVRVLLQESALEAPEALTHVDRAIAQLKAIQAAQNGCPAEERPFEILPFRPNR